MKHIMKNIDKDKIKNIWDNVKCIFYIILALIALVLGLKLLFITGHIKILAMIFTVYILALLTFTVSIIREIKKDKRNK